MAPSKESSPPRVLELSLEGKVLRSVEISPEGLSLGRKPGNDLILADRLVSAQHAKLFYRGADLVLQDLGSSAGTRVNGRTIQETSLVEGDEIQIGPFHLRLGKPREAPGSGRGGEGETAFPDSTGEIVRRVRYLANWTDLVGLTDQRTVLETLLERSMVLVGASAGLTLLTQTRDRFTPILQQGEFLVNPEAFSRSICRLAASRKHPVRLDEEPDLQGLSLAGVKGGAIPDLIVAIPLVFEGEVLGLVYLEVRKVDRGTLQSKQGILEEIGTVGGKALRTALDQQQILVERQKVEWLSALAREEPDLARTSRSPSMQAVLSIVESAATEDVTLLITGESGTGKEVLAQTVHRRSPRRDGPFVAINCGAIPRELIEGELFGHEKGAFTGAAERKPGRLEFAQGGTLFLDEVGDLPRDMQVKLLRVLETRQFQRLGGHQTLDLDIRVIAATLVDLKDAVSRGDFRADLYYRLNVIHIVLPPLRDRVDDIEPLVQEILLTTNRKFRRKMFGVEAGALRALRSYSWPGNVRELRNVIERSCILEKSDRITARSLPSEIVGSPAPAGAGSGRPGALPEDDQLVPLEQFLLEHEKGYIRHVLQLVGENVRQAARVLGMTRTALYRRMKLLGLRVQSGDEGSEDEEP